MAQACINKAKGVPNKFTEDGHLLSSGESDGLLEDYKEIGLISGCGRVNAQINTTKGQYASLAGANDDGVSWPELAKIIRANTTNFFTKSV